MKCLVLLAAFFVSVNVSAQPASVISEPQHIVVDSKDNVFVTLKYGMLKIAPGRHSYRSFKARSGYWRHGPDLARSRY